MVESPEHRLSLPSIAEAAETIDPLFLNTPLIENISLDETLGCHLGLKVETDNPIRSFKGRGADFFVSRVMARGDSRPMVCASTGNFGQAMAYACAKHDRPLIVYADEAANPVKINRIRDFGAMVRLEGVDFDYAKERAKRFSADSGAWMIEDGFEPEISEGAGSIGVELTQSGEAFDAVLIPLGNGALINGVARWLKATTPDTEIVGVSAAGADAMERSWRSGKVIEGERVDTIAEGIAVRIPVPLAVADMKGIVDDVVLVEDRGLIEAMQMLHRAANLIVEPSGAAGIAALMADPMRFAGTSVATILTGANLSDSQMMAWLGLPPATS